MLTLQSARVRGIGVLAGLITAGAVGCASGGDAPTGPTPPKSVLYQDTATILQMVWCTAYGGFPPDTCYSADSVTTYPYVAPVGSIFPQPGPAWRARVVTVRGDTAEAPSGTVYASSDTSVISLLRFVNQQRDTVVEIFVNKLGTTVLSAKARGMTASLRIVATQATMQKSP